jgi:hypothetical protein
MTNWNDILKERPKPVEHLIEDFLTEHKALLLELGQYTNPKMNGDWVYNLIEQLHMRQDNRAEFGDYNPDEDWEPN